MFTAEKKISADISHGCVFIMLYPELTTFLSMNHIRLRERSGARKIETILRANAYY